MIDQSIDDRLHKVKERLERLLSDDSSIDENAETTPEELSKFGLSFSQATTWLKREPNYLADAFSHEPQNGRRLHRTHPTANQDKKVLLQNLRITKYVQRLFRCSISVD